MMTIFPDLSISIRAICTPAALTALTALVTSCCRNVDGARAMASYRSAWPRRSGRRRRGAVVTSDAVKSPPSGPRVGGPGLSRRRYGGIFRPRQGSMVGAGNPNLGVGKVRKVGKVLSVMTETPFLTFPTFLALVPRKKAAG